MYMSEGIPSFPQLISKGLFGFFNSPKKPNEKFLPQKARAKINIFKFVFGNIKDTKISFHDQPTFSFIGQNFA